MRPGWSLGRHSCEIAPGPRLGASLLSIAEAQMEANDARGTGTGRNAKGRPVAVIIGATSKWQADGRNTRLARGKVLDDSSMPVGARWGVGGALAQKFAGEGFFTVLTTRTAANAATLAAAIEQQGGACLIVELDLASEKSIEAAFARIRAEAGEPEVLIYNAGYLEGRDLPPGKEL